MSEANIEVKSGVPFSCDVGFGETKCAWGGMHKEDPVRTMKFLSIAVPGASSSGLDDGHLVKRNSVTVRYKDRRFNVGPDAYIGMASNASRKLDRDFCRRPDYMALVLGAVKMAGVSRVSKLCLGLPVSTYRAHKSALEELARGKFEQDDGTYVEIESVVVVPQPLGGLFDMGIASNQLQKYSRETTLTIDPGHFTLDWIVTHGMKVVDERSDSADNNGMSAVLGSIAKSMSERIADELKTTVEMNEAVLVRLDHAITTGSDFKYLGRKFDYLPHLAAANDVIDDGIGRMMKSVGQVADMDNINLIGGGSKFYRERLAKALPSFEIKCPTAPIFSNVRGFQAIAVSKLARGE